MEARVRENDLLSVGPEAHPKPVKAVLVLRRSRGPDKGEREVAAGGLDRGDNSLLLHAHVAEYCRLEHDRERAEFALGEDLGKKVGDVALLERGRIGAHRLHRSIQALEPVSLVCPDEGFQQERVLFPGDVERRQVDAAPVANDRPKGEELSRYRPALLAGELELCTLGSPYAGVVAVVVPIPHEVQAGARSQLEEVEDLDACTTRDLEEAREEHPAPLNLVRLDPPLTNEAAEPVAPFTEHRNRIAPGIDALAQGQVVETAQKLKWTIPALALDDLTDGRLVGEQTAQAPVEL